MSRTSAHLPRSAAAAALEPIVVVVAVVRLARVDAIVASDKGNPESSCTERVVGGSHW